MSRESAILCTCSIALLLFVLLFQWLETRLPKANSMLRLLFILALVAALAYAAFELREPDVQPKGNSEPVPWLMVGLMYLSMVLGIVAQSFYFNENVSPSTSWIKPVLASPIIFIPLVSSYQSSLTNMGGVTLAELMILLVSFQNGFFWKVVFDKQAEALGKQKAS